MSIEVGSVLDGVVSGITNFGAFIELPEGKTGLVHISEVADEYVKDVHDFLAEKDKVKVKVVAIDEKGKIGLSIKQLQEKKAEETAPKPQLVSVLPSVPPEIILVAVTLENRIVTVLLRRLLRISFPNSSRTAMSV